MKVPTEFRGKLQIMEVYQPFSRPTAFRLIYDKDEVVGLWHSSLDYLLQWPRGSSAPRTGVLLCHYLDSFGANVPLVLDIGTGGSAVLAIHCARMGAGRVIGIDIDKRVLESARRNVDNNGLSGSVSIEEGDVSNFESEERAQMIIANLPHMPVPVSVSPHNDGGRDGRACITAFLGLVERCLRSDGISIFTAPDYLGINGPYSSARSIREIAAEHGLVVRVERRYKMEVRHGSYTAANMAWIRRMYPGYEFGRTVDGMPTHWLNLVSARFDQNKRIGHSNGIFARTW